MFEIRANCYAIFAALRREIRGLKETVDKQSANRGGVIPFRRGWKPRIARIDTNPFLRVFVVLRCSGIREDTWLKNQWRREHARGSEEEGERRI